MNDIYKNNQNIVAEVKYDDLILLLTREQVEGGCKQTKMNAQMEKNQPINLLGSFQPICVPTYVEDIRLKGTPVYVQLHEMDSNIQALTSQNPQIRVGEMTRNHLQLRTCIVAFQHSVAERHPNRYCAAPQLNVSQIQNSVENFLTKEQCAQVMSELKD